MNGFFVVNGEIPSKSLVAIVGPRYTVLVYILYVKSFRGTFYDHEYLRFLVELSHESVPCGNPDLHFRGAGKTTLLNVLAHRKIEHLEVTGTVYVREEPVGINIREMSAYVEDNDVFVGSLTVREHLIFQVYLQYIPSFIRV